MQLAPLSEGSPGRVRNHSRFRHSIRLGAKLVAAAIGTLGSLVPHEPSVREVALGHLQDYLPLSYYPSRQHLGVVRRAGGGGGQSELLFIGSKDPSEEDTSIWALEGLHDHVRYDKE